jgi:ABC-2 type transport system ATP-binding protein
MGTRPAVRARGIAKCFGDVVALDGVGLEVARGRIHGLVGPNGPTCPPRSPTAEPA